MPARVTAAMSKKQPKPTSVRTVKTGWNDVLLICKKCSKKLDGGFGEDGTTTLRKAIRDRLRENGQRGQVGLIDVRCFGVCPKRAVTVVRASNPSELLVIPVGVPIDTVLSPGIRGEPDDASNSLGRLNFDPDSRN